MFTWTPSSYNHNSSSHRFSPFNTFPGHLQANQPLRRSRSYAGYNAVYNDDGIDEAVERAAQEYAAAHSRLEAVLQRHAQEEALREQALQEREAAEFRQIQMDLLRQRQAAYEQQRQRAYEEVVRQRQRAELQRQRIVEEQQRRRQQLQAELLAVIQAEEQEQQRQRLRAQAQAAQLRRARSEIPSTYLFGEPPRVSRAAHEHRHRRPAHEMALELELDLNDLLAPERRQRPVAPEPQQSWVPPQALPREREQQGVRPSQRQGREDEQFEELLSRLLGFPVSLASASQPQGPVASTSTTVPVTTGQSQPTEAPKKMDKGKQRAEPAIPLPRSTYQVPITSATTTTTGAASPTKKRKDSDARSVHFKESEKVDDISTAVHHNCEPGTVAAVDADEEQVRATLHRTPALSPAHAKVLQQRLRKRHSADSMSLRSGTSTGSTVSSESSAGSQTEEEIEAQRRSALDEIEGVLKDLKALQKGFGVTEKAETAGFAPPPPTPSTPGSAQASTPTSEKDVALYTHALDALLARLDAIESGGNVEVRQKRREVVKEVEKLVGAMEGVSASPVEESVPEEIAADEAPAAAEAVVQPAVSEALSTGAATPADLLLDHGEPLAYEEPAPFEHEATLIDVSVPVVPEDVALTRSEPDSQPDAGAEPASATPELTLVSEALTTGEATPASLLDAGFPVHCEESLQHTVDEAKAEDLTSAQPHAAQFAAEVHHAGPVVPSEPVDGQTAAVESVESAADVPVVVLGFSEALSTDASAMPVSAGLDVIRDFEPTLQTPEGEVEESTVYTQESEAVSDDTTTPAVASPSAPAVVTEGPVSPDEADAAAADYDDAVALKDAVVATLAADEHEPESAAAPFLLQTPSLSDASDRVSRPPSWDSISDEDDLEIVHAHEAELEPQTAAADKKARSEDSDEVEEWSDLDSATTSD